MIDRRRPICRVSMSGFRPSENKPDTHLMRAINELEVICRVCRVFLGVETRRETVFSCSDLVDAFYSAHSIGLE